MVTRWFTGVLEQVGEALAPTVDTPLEKMKTHWKAVRNFYVDQKFDVVSFQKSAVPEHLVSMVTILVEEERAARKEKLHRTPPSSPTLGRDEPDQPDNMTFQPCLEFFLQNRIMETICLLGEKDLPSGMRKLVLQNVASMLDEMPTSLLPNMSVVRPLKSLIVNCYEQTALACKPEFVSLVAVVVRQLRAEPHLLEFFCTKHPDPTGGSNTGTELVPFTVLLPHITDEGVAGDRAREAAVMCMQFDDAAIRHYMVDVNGFIKLTVNALVSAYKSLPPQPPTPKFAMPSLVPAYVPFSGGAGAASSAAPSAAFASLPIMQALGFGGQRPPIDWAPLLKAQQFEEFRAQVKFVNDIVRDVENEVSASLLSAFEEDFLHSVLAPAVLQPNELSASTATRYLADCLAVVDAPKLQTTLSTFLIGEFTRPEEEDDENEHYLRATLMRRLQSTNQYELSLATLRLLDALLGFDRQPLVLHNLVLRTFIPRFHLQPVVPAPESPTSSLETLQSQIMSYVTLPPIDTEAEPRDMTTFPLDLPPNSAGFAAYLSDAQQRIADCAARCSTWSLDVGAPPPPSLTASSDNSRQVAKFHGGGYFLTAVFDKLERLLEQPFEMNLVLTGIIARLCHFPFPLLFAFLLHPSSLPLRPGIRTLFSILVKISSEIEQKAATLPDFKVRVSKARARLSAEPPKFPPKEPPPPDEEPKTKLFLEAVVVFEEFCKELGATLAVVGSQLT